MRVVVTGGAGYIGSAVVEALKCAGHEPIVIDDLSTGFREPERSEMVVMSILDRQGLMDIFERYRPHTVINIAGLKNGLESFAEVGRYFEVNSIGFENVLLAARGAGVKRVLQSSSCGVYSSFAPAPLSESSPTDPPTPYGLSKLTAEFLGRWWAEETGGTFTALRYFNIAGADVSRQIGERFTKEPTQIVPSFIRRIQRGEALNVYGSDFDTTDGTAVRDYLHILDVAEAHLLGTQTGEGGIFNLGSGSGYSIGQLVAALKKASGQVPIVNYGPRRRGDAARSVADSKKAGEILGWKPSRGIADICASAWKWHETRAGSFDASLVEN